MVPLSAAMCMRPACGTALAGPPGRSRWPADLYSYCVFNTTAAVHLYPASGCSGCRQRALRAQPTPHPNMQQVYLAAARAEMLTASSRIGAISTVVLC